jgi:hypothetical protein
VRSFIPPQTVRIKGQAIPMATISNPPDHGQPAELSACHRSWRAPIDPVLTAVLTATATESGPPGMKRGGHDRLPHRRDRVPDETRLEPFSLDREVSLKRRSASMAATKQRGAVMLAFILGFIYQHSCRKYLAAVRTYQRRWT